MFKKSLSLFLCLIMCVSFFSITAVETCAAYNVKTLFSVKGESIDGDLLTYTISVTKEQKNIGGIILNVDFDSTVLEPVEDNCGPVERTTTEEGTVKNFQGTYAYGVSAGNPDVYSIAYMNDIAVSTTEAMGFFKIQFRVIDPARPTTNISFYCKEYFSTTETEKNITVNDGRQIIAEYKDVSTLSKPSLVGVVPASDGLKVSWNGVEGAVGYEIRRCTSTTGWETVDYVGADVTEYVDTGLVSGTTYIYTVIAFNNYGVSLYDAVGLSCKYIEKPVVSSLRNAVGGVEVKWNSTAGADFYLIFRRVKGETEWTQIAKRSYSSGTTYKDTTVVDGTEYEYDVVSATDSYASPTSEEGVSVTYVSSPSVTSLTNTLSGIEIKWTAHPDATHYILYRRDRALESTLVEYVPVSTNYYVDKNVSAGKIYVYSVKACTNNGDSAYSVTGYTITRVAPTTVTALTLERAGVKVDWAAVSGVTGYNIYRKASSETSWTKAGSVNGNVTTFSDTGVKSGTQYTYAVCPTLSTSEGSKIESDPIYYIKAPTGVAGENIVDGIKVTWDESDGAIRYAVMRVDMYQGNVLLAEIDADEVLEYIDTEVSWNESYSYAVKAISVNGESLVGDSSVSILRIGAMGIATPELAKGGIRVTWEPYDEADGYAVFRNDGSGWFQVNEVTGPEYIDENVHSAKTYAYAVGAVIGESRGIVLTDDAPQLKYIAPVSAIAASNGKDFTKVTWGAVEGAVAYEIYKSEKADGLYTRVATTDAEILSYTDKNVLSGKNYYYMVCANDGEKSSVDSEPLKNTFLEIPEIKSIANAFGGVKFTWDAVEGAQGYRVYRKANGDKTWTYITTVGADVLTYTDSGAVNGTRMYYTVRAESEGGISTFAAKSVVYVTSPELTTSNTAKGIQLKWTKNPVADNYRIYRKAKSTDSWSYVATVTGTSYLDTTAKAGITYRYTIRANYGGVYSSYKSSGWAVRRLTTPTLKAAKNGNGYISVTWGKVTGATGYRVYRKENNASAWTYLGNVYSTSYKDTNVKNKATYTYTVRAFYGSSLSTFNSKGVSVKYLTTPTVTVANRTGHVRLTWNAVSGASSYYVYRKAGNAKSWTKIATVSKPGYIDKKVSNKGTYTYTVKAYGSKTLSGYNVNGWKTVYLDTPETLTAKSTKSGITFKWSPVKGCTSYSVFRKEGSGPWVQIGSVSSDKVSYTDKKAEMGIKYTYTVRAKYGSYLSWFESDLVCTHKY